MLEKKRKIFRKESLERLSSPERLDRLMQVISPKGWLNLGAFTCLILLGLGWSVLGKIPITVTGKGVIVNPRQMIELQSPITGQLQKLNIKVGDCFKKGDILAELAQPELQKQLQQQQNNLAELQKQDRQLSAIATARIEIEKQNLAQQRQNKLQRQRDQGELAIAVREQEVKAIQKERENLKQQLANNQGLTPILAQRLKIRQDLKIEGAVSTDNLLEAEQAYRNNLNEIANLQAQIQELEVREIKANQTYKDTQSQISDLDFQLQQLNSQEKNLIQQNLEAIATRSNKIQEVKRASAQLELQLQHNSKIISPQTGCMLEMTMNNGQFITPGTKLGTIATQDLTNKIVSLTYFPIKDGKQIKPEMTIQITPDTVPRERFGGIIGNIVSITPFPITKEEISRIVGNPEIAQSLVFEGGQIQVMAEMKRNYSNISGYQWSSSHGPDLQITTGTTTTARVTVGERAPITFILPFLRANTGIY